ncbi:Outer membrane protein romA [Minicystis rosea]|nr:Outer membrane protein romA [Minicystis rosea]
MLSRASFAVAALLASSTLSCAVSTMVGNNAVAFFQKPASVPHKIDRPFRADARLAVLWIGHASMLVQIDDKLILTDPVLTETVAQVSRRLVEPGIDAAAIPHVDAAIISHLHPDHLSMGSLQMLERKLGCLVVPEQGTAHVPDFAFETVELPFWRSFERAGLRITAVPVRHTGFRWGVDSMWMTGKGFSGYVIEYHGITVYFGGDTAYAKAHFEATRARFPKIDLAILPIAPARPRDIMEGMHIDPAEALDAFRDLGARFMVPMHHSTFINSVDPPTTSPASFRGSRPSGGSSIGCRSSPSASKRSSSPAEERAEREAVAGHRCRSIDIAIRRRQPFCFGCRHRTARGSSWRARRTAPGVGRPASRRARPSATLLP